MKFEVEWKSSHYHPDGRRRSRPKASAFHGWLVKWRATFSGNEHLRREGIREIREAKAMREYKGQRKATKRAKNGRAKPGLFSIFSFWKTKPRQNIRPNTSARGLHNSRKSNNSRQAVPGRTPISRRPTTQSSRQPSYDSKRLVARTRSSKK
ncbi:hypothetical protein BDR07DRAFT_1266900 [Suillus spraguei]|nr:hypothetical protein BDR07DRAFT_1266900 [Suillus spraguei]